MALRTPPSWLQNGSHPAENDRLTTQALYSATGIIGASSLAITAQASPNMTVNAASGWCAIAGSTANSGVYVAYNDATTVLTITTADPSLPRIDRIVVTVSDAYYSGSTNTVAFSVIAGTPASSPSAPATPSNSISLATIAVAAGAATIQSANITDTRTAATSSSFLPLTGGTVTGATTFSGATTVSGAFAISGATTLTNTLSSNSAISTTSTVTGFITPSLGTTSTASIQLSAGGSLMTTPASGSVEYSSVAYFTPAATSGRGLLGADHYYQLGSNYSLTNGTSAQSLFGVGFSPVAGRYEYEIVANLTTGSTTHNTSFGWGGTATLGTLNILYSNSTQGSAVSPNSVTSLATTGITLFSGNSTATTTGLYIRGIVVVTSAGTLIPQITFSAAPGASNLTNNGSFIRLRRLSLTTTGNLSVGAWA